MKITDLILAVENVKGKEYIYLLTKDALEQKAMSMPDTFDRRACIDFFSELQRSKSATDYMEHGVWADIYFAANHTLSVSYCHEKMELIGFLEGNYNNEGNWEFSREDCSSECLLYLDAMKITTDGQQIGHPSYSYHGIEHQFSQGEILHNFNGRDYKVLEVLSPKNLLLIDVDSGQFAVGIGTGFYERSLAYGSEVDAERGIEWSHGIYVGNTPSYVDFRIVRRKYGEVEPSNTISGYRIEGISEDDTMPDKVREAATEAMYESFMTGKTDVFMRNLENGKYDLGFTDNKELKEERAR